MLVHVIVLVFDPALRPEEYENDKENENELLLQKLWLRPRAAMRNVRAGGINPLLPSRFFPSGAKYGLALRRLELTFGTRRINAPGGPR